MASIIKRTDKPTIVRGMGSNAVLTPRGTPGPVGPSGGPIPSGGSPGMYPTPLVGGGYGWDDPKATYGFYLNVKAYGAKGDGTTDDTAAIQAAINASPTGTDRYVPVFLPAGDYRVAELDLTDKKVVLMGAGAYQTRLRYNGVGGAGTSLVKNTVVAAGAIPAGGFCGVHLEGKTPTGVRVECLYRKTGSAGHDWDFTVEDLIISGSSGDGLDFGPGRLINFHADRFRVDDLGGYAFRVRGDSGGEHHPITLTRFTVDCGTYGTVKGLLRVDNGQGYYIRVKDARLEGNVSMPTETIGTVTDRAWVLNVNTLNTYGAYYWFENVMGFSQSTDAAALLRDASAATNAVRARFDVCNLDNASLFKSDATPAANVAAVSPQDLQTRYASAG